MTPEQESLRDMWLAEMWPTCRELPREERAVQRALAQARPQLGDDTPAPRKSAAA